MATSAELIQLRNRLKSVIAAHDDSQGRTTVAKLQGIGVTPVIGVEYFTQDEVADLINNRYITRDRSATIVPFSNQISQAPGGSGGSSSS